MIHSAPMISPPVWGWPEINIAIAEACGDFPTRVGMARAGPHAFDAEL